MRITETIKTRIVRGSRSALPGSIQNPQTTKDTKVHEGFGSRGFPFGFLGQALCCAAMLLLSSCGAGDAPNFKTDVDVTPAEDSIGERLFLDTRFAQYFAAHMTGINQ